MLSALEIKIFYVRGQHTLSLHGVRQGRLQVMQVTVVSHQVLPTQRDPHRPLRERIVLSSDKTIYRLNLKRRKDTFDPCPYFSGLAVSDGPPASDHWKQWWGWKDGSVRKVRV